MAARRPHTTLSPAQPAATFTGLGVPAALAAVLAERGIDTPFPIQTATLPDSLAGRDVLGRGRTGSGKTYAFLLPMLARLAASNTPRRPGRPRALILAPTRELVGQITESLAPLAKALNLRTLNVFGGVAPRPQINGLRAGVDILVACPGRLADHMGEGHANLDAVEITVLDEADHMADLGFLPVVRRLLDTTPKGGQRLLFSATLDSGVDTLVRRYLSNPVTHSVDSAQSPVTAMTHHVLQVRAEHRLPVLADLAAAPGRTVVFTRTKRGATKLTKQLIASGVPAVELHGNLGQSARTRNLGAFAEGRISTLVATDIAARGIHVDDVTLVVHADPPMEHKAYLHRSGRTARAGAAGTVVTLMTADQAADVRDLTRKAGISPQLTKVTPEHPLLAQLAVGERSYVTPPPTPAPSERQPARRAAAGGGGRGGAGARRGSGGRAGAAPRNGAAPDEGSGSREGAGQRGGSGQRTGSGRGGSGRGGSGRGDSGWGGSGRGDSSRGGSDQRSGSGQRGGPRAAKDADTSTGARRGGSGARRAPASPVAAATPAGSAASFSAKSRAGARRSGR